MRLRHTRFLLAFLLPLLLAADKPSDRDADKQALIHLQDYIGDWRGVGQPRRGSTRGAWRETCGWAWQLSKEDVCFTFQAQDAK